MTAVNTNNIDWGGPEEDDGLQWVFATVGGWHVEVAVDPTDEFYEAWDVEGVEPEVDYYYSIRSDATGETYEQAGFETAEDAMGAALAKLESLPEAGQQTLDLQARHMGAVEVEEDYEDLETPGRVVHVFEIVDGVARYEEVEGPSLDEMGGTPGDPTIFSMPVADFEKSFRQRKACPRCKGIGAEPEEGEVCPVCEGDGLAKDSAKVATEGTWEFDSVNNIWSYGLPGSEATATVEKLEDDELTALVPGADYVWTIDGPAEGDEDGDWGTVDEGEAGSLEQAKADAAAAFDGLYSRGKV